MTTLANGKTVKRRISVRDRGRDLNVEIHDRYVELWRTGTRERVRVDWESVYSIGLKRAAAAMGITVPQSAGKRRHRV